MAEENYTPKHIKMMQTFRHTTIVYAYVFLYMQSSIYFHICINMKKPSLKKTGNKNTIKHPITIPIGSSRMVYMQKNGGILMVNVTPLIWHTTGSVMGLRKHQKHGLKHRKTSTSQGAHVLAIAEGH